MSNAPAGRVLILAPHATRTGSSRVLIELMRGTQDLAEVDYAVELASGGPWADELRAFGPPLRPGEQPAVVVANTCLTAEVLDVWSGRVPTAIYLHEPGDVMDAMSTAARRGIRNADRVLCVSEQVRLDAIRVGANPSATVVLPPMAAPVRCPSPHELGAARAALGAGPGQRIVVGCGEAGRRKGADLFLEVGRKVAIDPTVHLAWIGRRVRPFRRQLDHDVEAVGLRGRMTWMGDVSDALPYLAVADVLVVTSRYDPQPLVPLEAASVATPSIGFELDGMAELAAAGGALTVQFPDTTALARLTVEVMGSPSVSTRLVRAAQARYLSRQAPEAVLPQWTKELRGLLERRR